MLGVAALVLLILGISAPLFAPGGREEGVEGFEKRAEKISGAGYRWRRGPSRPLLLGS